MKLLRNETADAESLAVDGAETPTEPIALAYHVPTDAGQKNAFGWGMCDSLEGQGGFQLSVTERGIWPSAENPYAFDALVRCVAENGLDYKDEDQGALTFGDHEIDLLRAMVMLCLTNIWGFVLANPARSSIMVVDHHEEIRMLTRSGAQADAWREFAARYELTPL